MNLQLGFELRARTSDPTTSKAAAKTVSKFAGAHYQVILDALCYGPQTIFEISKTTERLRPHLDHYQVGRRCGELHKAGYITRRGEIRTEGNGEIIIECEKRPSPTGNPSAVWELTHR